MTAEDLKTADAAHECCCGKAAASEAAKPASTPTDQKESGFSYWQRVLQRIWQGERWQRSTPSQR